MNNFQEIWQLSLQILGYQSYSEHHLRQKLYHKGYTVSEVDNVINKLITYGYINDHEFAAMLFAKYLKAGKYSLNAIIAKLRQRGLSNLIIKDIVSSYDPDEEYYSALKIANQRFTSLDSVTKEKVYRFLGTRGFTATTIHKVLHSIFHTKS